MNINDNVWVRLTSEGEKQWASYWNVFSNNGGIVPRSIQKSQREVDGRVRFQMHEIMNIFGPECFNGSSRLPFIDNVIEIETISPKPLLPPSEGQKPTPMDTFVAPKKGRS